MGKTRRLTLLPGLGYAFLALCLGCLAPAGRVLAREFPGLSQRGPTGLVLVPTGQFIRSNYYAVGLHRGVLKAAYGVLDILEFGVATPDLYDQPNSIAWKTETTGFVKVGYDGWGDSWWLPGLAAGAENSLWNMAVKRRDAITGPAAREAESYYGLGSWDWRIASWPVEATVGGGTGRFAGRVFGAVGVIPTTFFGSTMKFFGEYAGRAADVGARIALSRTLRLDFAMEMNADRESLPGGGKQWTITMNRGLIGASRVSPVSWESLWPAKIPGTK
jgi:hypothetical protein